MTDDGHSPSSLRPDEPRDLVLKLRRLVAERTPADVEIAAAFRARSEETKKRYQDAQRHLAEQFEAEKAAADAEHEQARQATVGEALDLMRGLPHAGGGSVVLADASGAAAAVELRHGRVEIEQGACVARTNHYTGVPDCLMPVAHSPARLATLRAALAKFADPRAILALHAPEALCRHDPDPSPTLAGAVYDTVGRTAAIAFGPPCTAPWRAFALGAEGWREILS